MATAAIRQPQRMRGEHTVELTPAQQRVYALLVQTSLTGYQIAKQLMINHDTYQQHAKMVYRKLRVSGRVDILVRLLGRQTQ